MVTMLTIFALKFVFIGFAVVSNGVLALKILNRKNLHTIFNLSICFFFTFSAITFPFTINEYGNLIEQILGSEAPDVDSCRKLHILRMINMQGYKVFFLNIIFRFVTYFLSF